ncbi:MAG: hypothetical protein E7181_03100 [Erysipelotrichaceae bacterium]|nr:hypothetical protein [Erysipelotrichaceae bacterium]
MKKYFSLSTCLAVLALIFAGVCFGLMFTDQLSYTIKILGGEGTATLSFSDTFFGKDGVIAGFIGYLLVLIGGLLVCGSAFIDLKNKNMKFFLFLFFAVILFAGSALILLEPVFFNNQNGTGSWSSSIVSGSGFRLSTSALIAGILGLASGVTTLAAALYSSKK